MRSTAPSSFLFGMCGLVAVVLSTGCGPKKPAEDASSESPAAPPPGAPGESTDDTKWDGSSTTTTPKPTTTAGTGVTQAPGRRHNEPDKDSVEIEMKRGARAVKEHCGETKDDAGKASGPWGKTKVSVVLGRNGRVKGVTVPAPFDGTPVGKCIVNSFANGMFMPWNGPDATIDWDIEVVQPAPPPAPEKPEKPKK